MEFQYTDGNNSACILVAMIQRVVRVEIQRGIDSSGASIDKVTVQ